MKKKRWVVVWRMPLWAAKTIIETIELDTHSSAFTPELRREIQKAWDTVEASSGRKDAA